jgi:uncharacterized protein (TIGR03437 family)
VVFGLVAVRHWWRGSYDLDMSRGVLLVGILLGGMAAGRSLNSSGCATSRETPAETAFLHRQMQRAHALRARAAAAPAANRDIGDIAIIEDAGGVVERQNQFNLDNNTVAFIPSGTNASHNRYAVTAQGYDAVAANGTPLAALDDDDARQVALPFPFPFFGAVYNQVFVNSDGNLTFTAAEFASTDRSLGRMTAGPPRIAPLFDDLDPSKTAGGVRVLASPSRVVVSWAAVPEYSDSGNGAPETFQVRLYPDGRIEFAYSGIYTNLASAVVGIAPGHLQGTLSLVDFRSDATGDYTAAVAERFGNTLAVDIVTAAQKFYQTHDDSYDYLVIYNNLNIPAAAGAVAYESTVRASGSGYNVPPTDSGTQYGSGARLQAVLNLGPLSQYPADPAAVVPARAQAGDTPLSVIAHEAGHLFLAYASVPDPNNPAALPMLGYQLAHWSFAYDSEASLLEGERIADLGAGVSPRFLTTDTVQGYSPLDQYLMGFRAAAGVADTFYVANPSFNGVPFNPSFLHPQGGIGFDGTRRNVAIADVIQAVGRRTPDYTVAQRRFRFAFILVVPQGAQPTADELAQVDGYRRQFENYYGKASSSNGIADTTLRKGLRLSIAPAAGVVLGYTGAGTVTVATAPAADLTVKLQTQNGNAQFPATARIASGSTTGTFSFTGIKAGVEEVLATPADATYETAAARVQVADQGSLQLTAVSGDHQISTAAGPLPDPVVVRLSDVNNLPYPGERIDAVPSGGGSVSPASAVTDALGQASFQWTPGSADANQLQLAVSGIPVGLTVSAGRLVPVVSAVVNAASYEPGVAAGAIESIFGVNLTGGKTAQAGASLPTTLAGARVLLNGTALPLLYASDTQINFFVPPSTALGRAALTVNTPAGAQAAAAVNLAAVQPGIFSGAILKAGTAASAVTSAVSAGDYIEIYCTGLGQTQASGAVQRTVLTPAVFIGATPVQPVFSGLAPGYTGLYQVDVQVPKGLAAGAQPVIVELNLQHSNAVNILLN